MKKIAIGVDVGGSHVSATAIGLNNPEIVKENIHRIKVDEWKSAERILSAWTEVIWQAIDDIDINDVAGVGLAMPGPFDYEKGISGMKQKFEALYGMNIKELLSKRLNIAEDNIRFKNDAECYLLGEVFGGAGKNSKRTIGVTLGTGFGSAFVFDGQSEDANLWCAPFRGAIAEDFMSTRWFKSRYEELTGKDADGAREISEAARKGDLQAKAVFDEFGNTLCEFVAPLIIKHNADTVVVGGNIAASFDLFSKPLIQKAAEIKPNILIAKAKLGEESPMVGAASLLNI